MTSTSTKIGYVFGWMIRWTINLSVLVGIIVMSYHHEFPWLPIILFLAYRSWVNSVFTKSLALVTLSRTSSTLTEEDVITMINVENWKRSMGMGPN